MIKKLLTLLIAAFLLHNTIQGMQPAKADNIWEAAKKADIQRLTSFIETRPSLINPKAPGPTPLAWAAIQPDPNIPSVQYENAVKFLVQKGALTYQTDPQQPPVLHKAAQGGNINIIRYLLDSGAAVDINKKEGKELRTPIAEALRSHKDSTIPLTIADRTLNEEQTLTDEEFEALLPEAIQQLTRKKERKLSNEQVATLMRLLGDYGADASITDKKGFSLEHYIQNVMALTAPEQTRLIEALKIQPSIPALQPTYSLKDIDRVYAEIEKLQSQQLDIPAETQELMRYKIRRLRTLLNLMLAATDNTQKIALLRVAQAYVRKINELTQQEELTRTTRTFLRDLLIAQKGIAVGVPVLQPPAEQKVTVGTIRNESDQEVTVIVTLQTEPVVIETHYKIPIHYGYPINRELLSTAIIKTSDNYAQFELQEQKVVFHRYPLGLQGIAYSASTLALPLSKPIEILVNQKGAFKLIGIDA